MTAPPRDSREWREAYRRRAALDPLRAVLDEGDPDNRKNAYVNAVERFHLRRALRGLHPAVAVDLGCGVGRLTDLLTARAATTIGIDASEDLLRVARAGPAMLAGGTVSSIPLRTGTADLVLCCGVLLHLTEDNDLAAATREVRRLLRPGGTVLLLEHLAPGSRTLRREGVVHRAEADLLAPFLAENLALVSNRPVRKTPSRLVHWVRRGRLPRFLWGLAARLEPALARRGRAPPDYRDHLIVLRG